MEVVHIVRVFFCALAASSSAQALACRCVEPVAPKIAYRNASVAVRAEVVALRSDVARDATTATLKVSQRWKGEVSQSIEVITDSTCAYPFENGREYVLFLQKDRGLPGYSTARCMGNQPIDKADPALKWLEKYGKAKAAK
jgi:hypothetical protein